MNNPIYSDPEWMHKFLHNAAIYFESRPTDGEDTAYWANVYNAEKCIKIADEITRLSARVAELEVVLDFYACIDHYQTHNAAAPNVVQNDRGVKARVILGLGKK